MSVIYADNRLELPSLIYSSIKNRGEVRQKTQLLTICKYAAFNPILDGLDHADRFTISVHIRYYIIQILITEVGNNSNAINVREW